MFKNTSHKSGGMFIDDVWMCDCKPRLPVERFQTRKEGVNHGRWCELTCPTIKQNPELIFRKVYVCQNPKPKQCNFFLWESDAKLREEGIVGSSSRSETRRPPATPPPPSSRNNPYHTPTSNSRRSLTRPIKSGTPSKPPRHAAPTNTSPVPKRAVKGWSDDDGDDEDWEGELFDWLLSEDEATILPDRVGEDAMRKTATNPAGTRPKLQSPPPLPSPSTTYMPPPHTPSKAPRTANATSPNKRSRSPSLTASPTPIATPATRTIFGKQDPAPLASEILTLLESHSIPLPTSTTAALTQICTTFALRAKGIARGRDVARDALKEKEKVIRELRQRIQELEAERERDRVVIGSLRKERLRRFGGGMGDNGTVSGNGEEGRSF